MKRFFPDFISCGFACLMVVLGMLSSLGCVRQTIEPEYNPRVTTSQNSDGEVTLSWKALSGYRYRLYVMTPDTKQWVPLKKAGSFTGTGKTVEVKDRRNPRKPLPWYSVRAEKL